MTKRFYEVGSRVVRVARLLAVAVVVIAGLLLVSANAEALPYAPINEPGPALEVPAALLKASLSCQPGVRDTKVEPVLLNPGTGNTVPGEDFGGNWEPALDRLGIPWCAYTTPQSAMGDIQTSGEYLVYAIRVMYALAHRKIAILGHSQGGMSMRWALRFWPDTRADVEDVIGLAPDNHGTTQLTPSKCAAGCTAAIWQQAYDSPFMQALNSGAETFPGISYTNIYTHTDEIVQPSSRPADCSGCLHSGGGQITNVAIQNICPADASEHLAIVDDNAAYTLALDTLTNPGPADPTRIAKSTCSQPFMPGATAASAASLLQIATHAGPDLGIVSAIAGTGIPAAFSGGAPVLRSEPPLACYVTASCPATNSLMVKVNHTRAVKGKRITLRFTVTVTIDNVTSPVPSAAIRVGNGRRLTTDPFGRASTTVAFGRSGRHHVLATATEYLDGHATITVAGRRAP